MKLGIAVGKLLLPLAVTGALLAGCGGQPAPGEEKRLVEQTKAPFEATAHLTYQQMESTVTISKDPDRVYHFTFQQPPALTGMELDLAEGQVTFRYKGLEMKADPNTLSSSAVAKLLASTLEAVAEENGVDIELKDGAATIKGEAEGTRFLLTVDRGTGNFLSLEVPDSGFAMEFSGFQFF